MLVEYVDRFNRYNVVDRYLTYKLQKSDADSEESFLGLGIAQNNRKTWFDF